MSYNYGYRKGYGYKSSYPYGNGVKRRAIQSIKAANSQNSTINFALKVNYAFSARYDSASNYGVATINIYDVLMKSQNFLHLKNMYDSVKVNGVNVKINVVDADSSIAELSAVKSINVVTAWDKSGLSVQDCEFGDGENNTITEDHYDDTGVKKFMNKIGSKITGYGSVTKGLLNQYQKFTRFEKCWPTTGDEKTCYIPTTTFRDFIESINGTTSQIQLKDTYSDMCVHDIANNNNPVIPFENSAISWKPTLLVGVFKSTIDTSTGAVDQYGNCGCVLFNAEFTIPCTFKGLKGEN